MKFAIDDAANPGEKIMTVDEICEFIQTSVGENCSRTDSRVSDILRDHNTSKDGKLKHSEFIEFYRKSCFNKQDVVRKNLLKYNYNSQLKHMPESGQDLNIHFLAYLISIKRCILKLRPSLICCKQNQQCFGTCFGLKIVQKNFSMLIGAKSFKIPTSMS
jgi:hypothetical protein